MYAIHFIVDKMPVSSSNRDIAREMRTRLTNTVHSKEEKKVFYKIAINRHEINKAIYRDFISS